MSGAALGGAAGHTIGGVHSHMATGRDFGDAVKAHGEDLVRKVTPYAEHGKNIASEMVKNPVL
jgi:hypothetical protein